MVHPGSENVSPIVIAHQIFHDIDELKVVSRANSQRDVQLTQLSLEQLRCEYYMVDFGDIRMTFATTTCPVRCTGPKVKGHIDFACVLNQHQPTLMLHGYRTSHRTLSGMDTNLETDMLVPPGQVFFTLQVRHDLVESCAEALNREDLITRNWQDNFVYAPETLPPVQDFLREMLTVIQQRPVFLQQSHCRTLMLEDLLPLLIGALPLQSTATQGLKPIPRAAIVKAAEAYLQDYLERPLTVKSLAETLNASERTLFSNFCQVFNIGPMAYLKVHRLRAVRRILLAAEPGTTTVAKTAQRFGFWSPGHFARDYRAMFGETPREALKRTKI